MECCIIIDHSYIPVISFFIRVTNYFMVSHSSETTVVFRNDSFGIHVFTIVKHKESTLILAIQRVSPHGSSVTSKQ